MHTLHHILCIGLISIAQAQSIVLTVIDSTPLRSISHNASMVPGPAYTVSCITLKAKSSPPASYGEVSTKTIRYSDTCALYPPGPGPVPEFDSGWDFYTLSNITNAATSAMTPINYVPTFTNMRATAHAHQYIGHFELQSYDAQYCAAQCDSDNDCESFNILL